GRFLHLKSCDPENPKFENRSSSLRFSSCSRLRRTYKDVNLICRYSPMMLKSGDLRPDDGGASGSAQSTPTRLSDLLLQNQYNTREQQDQALQYQRQKGRRIGQCLLKLGYLTEEILHSVLSRQFGLELIDPSTCEIDADILKLLPRELAVRLQVIPIRR